MNEQIKMETKYIYNKNSHLSIDYIIVLMCIHFNCFVVFKSNILEMQRILKLGSLE